MLQLKRDLRSPFNAGEGNRQRDVGTKRNEVIIKKRERDEEPEDCA